MMNISIKGFGAGLPTRCVSNEEISRTVDTTDIWIRERTGITQRYIAEPHQFSSDLAIMALKEALVDANNPHIDGIIVATTTPDLALTPTAAIVQKELGYPCFAFDVQAVCSGYIHALAAASSMIHSGIAQNIAVIGADTMTKLLDWNDRSTCVLFGDGAGCTIIGKSESASNNGLLTAKLWNDGNLQPILNIPKGRKEIYMNGPEVFKNAVLKMHQALVEALHASQLSLDDIDIIIPHQANQRIFNALAEKAGFEESKCFSSVGIHANTGAASIPLALYAAKQQGLLDKQGQLIAMPAAGAGFSWGCVIWKL